MTDLSTQQSQTPESPQPPKSNPAQSRRAVLIIGGVILAFSAYLLVFLVPDVLKNAVGPDSMSMARAAEIATGDSTYATLEDGEWQCDTIVYVRGASSTNTSYRTLNRSSG